MGEMSIAQIILTMSLQQAGMTSNCHEIQHILSDNNKVENVIVTLAPAQNRERLLNILKKDISSLTSDDKSFINDLVTSNSNKFNIGKGTWD